MSATSSLPLLEPWCITTLLPGAYCNPAPYNCWPWGSLLSSLRSPLPSHSVPTALIAHHASLSQAQPLPRGFQRAKLVPCCNLWGCQPHKWGTDLWSSSLRGTSQGESEMWWSSSFTSSAFSRKWPTLGPGSPFVFVCVCVCRVKHGKHPTHKSDLQEKLST